MVMRRFLGLGPHPTGVDAPPEPSSAGSPSSETRAPAEVLAGETASVRRIVSRLEALPPDQARYLAGFAYILSRAANADLAITDDETSLMERLLAEVGGLDEAQAVLVVQIAKLQSDLYGSTEDYLVTREFARVATDEQRRALIRSCFLVTAADETITAEEASVVNEIARELGLDRAELNAIREEFVDKLSVIQRMRREAAGT